MRKKQQGITAIGLVIVLSIFGFIAFGVIQMVPVYLENMKVVQMLNQISDELSGNNATLMDITKAVEKRVDIEDLRGFDWRQELIIARSSNGYTVAADYERQKAFVANISLLAEFTHEVEITR
jgi:hypothetical protein